MPRLTEGPSVLSPWLDYSGRWVLCVAIAAVDALGLWHTGISVDQDALRGVATLETCLLATGLLFVAVGTRIRVAKTPYGAVTEMFLASGQIMFFILAAGITTYLGASLNAPLVDAPLAQFDATWGLERSAIDSALHYPLFANALFSAYLLLFPTFFVLLLVDAARGTGGTSDLMWGFFLCALLTSIIAAMFPAIGYDGMIGHRHIAVLEQIRSGEWTALGVHNADGIVTFPSFHAALAVILAYDARRSRFTALIVWPIAALIVMATPLCGGHYVADAIAGIAIALFAIAAIRAKGHFRLSALHRAYRAPHKSDLRPNDPLTL